MKAILIILLGILACSCENTPNDLKGIWIGGYNAEKGFDNDDLYINGPLKELFEISNDSIHFKTFRSPYNELNDTIKSYSYSFENNVLRYGNDSLVFEQITKDSVVIINNFNQQYRNVYKRVEIEISPNVEYTEDLYAIELGDWNDTLEFLENGRVLRINDRDLGDGRVHDWYISSYKDLNFFVVVGQVDIPYLISGKDYDRVDIQLYYDKIDNGSMKRLIDFDNGRKLIGDWEMIETKNQNVLCFYDCFDNHVHGVVDFRLLNMNDSIARLHINKDSLTINQFGLGKKVPFWADKTSRFIFLDSYESSNVCSSWKLEWQGDSIIYMTTNSGSYNGITLKKVKS